MPLGAYAWFPPPRKGKEKKIVEIENCPRIETWRLDFSRFVSKGLKCMLT